jgi:1-pyrroline-5-carboxylate dehydrogenase
MAPKEFKFSYATMFNPPEEMHTRFEEGLARVKASLGKEYGMIINGKDYFSAEKFEKRSPVNTDVVLGVFQKGSQKDAEAALKAARKAFPAWSHMKWEDRVALIHKADEIWNRRLYEIGAAMAMETGKNRMESLGDVSEMSALMQFYSQMMIDNKGFVREMGRDPLTGFTSTNRSVLRPYGVWVVISPFNFPAALSGGPGSAALVAGNTLVLKPASDTPWTARLLVECLREAGVPDGVVNYVTGPGSTMGQALIDSPEVDGITFTGSYDVGMQIHRSFAQGNYVRPVLLELGGKNSAIVTRHANLDDAAIGIMRSAFGLQGQKCSACSRILVETPVYDEFVAKLLAQTEKIVIGDPIDRSVYMGPVINKKAYQDYQTYVDELRKDGKILIGGKVLTEGQLGKGYFVAPTLVELPLNHRLWKIEMFEPISTIGKVKSLDEALEITNSVKYGLTAGVYGNDEEVEKFYDKVEAGVTYANRPQGSTTGAWPGFQPFGGWKGSGSSGKNAGGLYYLQFFMHEQIWNNVKHS